MPNVSPRKQMAAGIKSPYGKGFKPVGKRTVQLKKAKKAMGY